MEKTVTRIGTRPNSFIRTWHMPDINRSVYQIIFYNDNGIIAENSYAWLSSNPEYRDISMYDIKSIEVKKEVKHHNANYNLEKAMANKCHFTINVPKKNAYDDVLCNLYLYVSNEDDKEADFILNNVSIHKELLTFSYEFKAQIQTWKRAEIKILCDAVSNNEINPQTAYVQAIDDRNDITYEKYVKELDELYDKFREMSIYVEKADIARIFNSFKLVAREETLLQKATKELKETNNISKVLEY